MNGRRFHSETALLHPHELVDGLYKLESAIPVARIGGHCTQQELVGTFLKRTHGGKCYQQLVPVRPPITRGRMRARLFARHIT